VVVDPGIARQPADNRQTYLVLRPIKVRGIRFQRRANDTTVGAGISIHLTLVAPLMGSLARSAGADSVLRLLKGLFKPKINSLLWEGMAEIISEHDKVYQNICRYYYQDRSAPIFIKPEGLLKYRLLGASFLCAAVKTTLYKGRQAEVDKKAVDMVAEPFSLNSKEPYNLGSPEIASVINAVFPEAQKLIAEDLQAPFTNFKALYAFHFDALNESIQDRGYLEKQQPAIAGSVTSPMACVSELING